MKEKNTKIRKGEGARDPTECKLQKIDSERKGSFKKKYAKKREGTCGGPRKKKGGYFETAVKTGYANKT